MSLFWKKHIESVPVVAVPDRQESAKEQSTESTSKISVEEKLYKEWLQRNLLSEDEIRMLQERKRLLSVRLTSTEHELNATIQQIFEGQRRFDLEMHHKDVLKLFYAANKAFASIKDDRDRLVRFEQCESALPLYHRQIICQDIVENLRKESAQLDEKVREAMQIEIKMRNTLDSSKNLCRDKYMAFNSKLDTFQAGVRIDGIREQVVAETDSLKSLSIDIKTQLQRYESLLDETSNDKNAIISKLESVATQFHTIDIHNAIWTDIGTFCLRLELLNELRKQRETLVEQAGKSDFKIREMNQRLSSLLEEDMRFEQTLSTIMSEMQIHRSHNHGKDGLGMQMQLLALHKRCDKLKAAHRLWLQLCTIFDKHEKIRHKVLLVTHELERLEQEILVLEMRERTLSSQAEEKRYNYILSKGQNVVSLRSQLKEGVACSVCGAMAHPFHSDTALEQKVLISEWKSEAEHMEQELHGVQEQLMKLRMERSANEGALAELKKIQKDVKGSQDQLVLLWEEYDAIDHSLNGCNSSMAAERSQTLLGLIDMCNRDAEKLASQLETYNFHQTSINSCAERLDKAENERAELRIQLNEVNTECQVMASYSENLRKQADDINKQFQTLYSVIDNSIGISDWFARWQDNHDGFILYLMNSASDWRTKKSEIENLESQQNLLETKITLFKQLLNTLNVIHLSVDKRINELNELNNRFMKQYERLFPTGDSAHNMYKTVRDEYEDMQCQYEGVITQTMETLMSVHETIGKGHAMSDFLKQTTGRLGDSRYALDDWMYKFRSTGNRPCRLEELTEIFSSTTDWNQLRDKIRRTEKEYEIAELHENEVRTQLMSLQSEKDTSEVLARKEKLILKIHELQHEIAMIDAKISHHEQVENSLL